MAPVWPLMVEILTTKLSDNLDIVIPTLYLDKHMIMMLVALWASLLLDLSYNQFKSFNRGPT